MKKRIEDIDVGRRYNSYASAYSKLYFSDKTDDIYLDRFLKGVKRSGRVLDIGCGPGRDLVTLTERGFKAYGIDISKKMIKIAKEKNPKANIKKMDAVELDFPDNFFEGVLSLYVLDYLSTELVLKAFGEIFRVLKDGGLFLLILHEGDFEGERPDLMAPGKLLFRNFKSVEWLENKLKKFGFEINFSEKRKFPLMVMEESSDFQVAIIAAK